MPAQKPKTVLCIHSNAGFGRCSTAIIQPVLAVMGCQPVMLPTTLLSTHTGGYSTPARLDCTAFGLQVLDHYAALGLDFDCIFSGYLGSPQQAALARRAFALWPAAYKVVDPAMADHGRLYAGITPELFDAMRALCRGADLILPNLTEAHLLLDRPLPADPDAPADAEAAQALAAALTGLAPAALVTGVPLGQQVGCAGADRGTEIAPAPAPGGCAGSTASGTGRFLQQQPLLPRSYHGTGDLFAAVLVGALMQGQPLQTAAGRAAAFVAAAIQNTPADADKRQGVWFEPLLGRLARGTE